MMQLPRQCHKSAKQTNAPCIYDCAQTARKLTGVANSRGQRTSAWHSDTAGARDGTYECGRVHGCATAAHWWLRSRRAAYRLFGGSSLLVQWFARFCGTQLCRCRAARWSRWREGSGGACYCSRYSIAFILDVDDCVRTPRASRPGRRARPDGRRVISPRHLQQKPMAML